MYLKRVPAMEQCMEPAESLLPKHQHVETIKTQQTLPEGSTGEAKLHLCHQSREQEPRADHRVTLNREGTAGCSQGTHTGLTAPC